MQRLEVNGALRPL